MKMDDLDCERSTLVIQLEQLAPFLDDPTIREIVINKPGGAITERDGGQWQYHALPDLTYEWCDDFARALASDTRQDVAEAWSLLGATLPGGQRVQMVLPPAVAPGTVSITIRRPGRDVLTLEQIVDSGAFARTRLVQSVLLAGDERARLEDDLSDDDKALLLLCRAGDWHGFLRVAVRHRKNIVSSGATSSGKTTLGNALAALIAPWERVITLEDTAEMRLPHVNQVNLFYSKGGTGVSRLAPRDLLEACLRMRPDRVLLAELRGSETFFFIQNVLNSGQPGTITTVHATGSKLAFNRIALMIKGSPEGAGLDLHDIKHMLYTLVDVVLQMERLPDGQRIVTEVYYDPAFAAHQLG